MYSLCLISSFKFLNLYPLYYHNTLDFMGYRIKSLKIVTFYLMGFTRKKIAVSTKIKNLTPLKKRNQVFSS